MKKLFYFFLIITSSINSQTLVQTVNLPAGAFYNFAYGLVYANGNYWLSSESSSAGLGILYAVNSQGQQVQQLNISYASIRASQGLAFDGINFWYVERKAARTDLFKVSPSGAVLDSILSTQIFGTSFYFGGAAWDGTGLWVSVYSPDSRVGLYKINPTTKQIVDSIATRLTFPAQLQPQGLTVKGDTLFWVNDGFQGTDRIYAVRISTKDTLFSFNPPEIPGQRQNPRGLAWDGNHLWLLAEPVGATSGRRLFKYDLSGAGSPGINLITTTINFGNVMIGNSQEANILIRNYGTANLTINSVNISNSAFTLNTSLPKTIPPSITDTFKIVFTPTVNMLYQDSIRFYHNDVNFEYSRTLLNGAGVYGSAHILFEPTSINFGDKRTNSTSYRELKIINAGTSVLTIDSVRLKSNRFQIQGIITPLNIGGLSNFTFRLWFNPIAVQNYSDSLIIYSNATNGNTQFVHLQGSGVNPQREFGNIYWQGQIPDNPGTSLQNYTPRSMKKIQDINGDGIMDLVVATQNYWTLVFNGNSSGWGDILWRYSTYFGSINTGAVEQEQCMQIASDLNGDGFQDVVVGTGGGNEFVYALNGRTGQVLWQFGNASSTDDGDIMGLDVKRDFTGDGIPDVLAAASGNETTGAGRFSVYLLNGVNGNQIWRINQAPQQKLKYMVVSTDAGGAFGSRVGTLNEVFGFNSSGNIIWTFNTAGSPWTVKEIPNIGGSPSSDVLVGTTTGNIYLLDGLTGTLLWTTNIGSVFIEDLIVVPDVNNSGKHDVLASGISQTIFMLEGLNGSIIWQNSTGGNILGKDVLSDFDGDGITEVGSASLNNLVHTYDGVSGQMKFNYAFGTGGNSTAAEHVVDLTDIDQNFSREFVAGSRDGRIVCFSGGENIIPVELENFTVSVKNNDVHLYWTTVTELNNKGFFVERKDLSDHSKSWKEISFIPGNGTTTNISRYSYVDKSVSFGEYFYRIKQVDFDGTLKYYDEIRVDVGIPNDFSLAQNFPNPFGEALKGEYSTTKINYSIALSNENSENFVTLKVFDLLGREVATLFSGLQSTGNYEINFRPADFNLSSGVYFYKVSVSKKGSQNNYIFSDIKKMIYLR
jgi:outer membrane protein assembly factor BamB